MAISRREMEIRRKIKELKQEGKIKDKDYDPVQAELDADDDDTGDDLLKYTDVKMQKLFQQKESLTNSAAAAEYADQIKKKLRQLDDKKSQPLQPLQEQEISTQENGRTAQFGSLTTNTEQPQEEQNDDNILDPALFEDEANDCDDDEDDEDLIALVAQKMAEKQLREVENLERDRLARLQNRRDDREQSEAIEPQQQQQQPPFQQTTSGIGGAYRKNETAMDDTRSPSRGSWGVFPRPKDISKAYGGGRKIMADDATKIAQSREATKDKLKAYRENVGIDVQAEKDHALEIEEAMRIGNLAMQRGMYGTAVSALEKVTKYCGTNSKLGGKVFLELAMAYEAEGRLDEATQVYSTLSTCRIEDIKYDAKRLLYGLQAMNFMRNEAKMKSFSKKKIKQTFVDTTGLANIAENFDDRYNTAWIDMDKGSYRKLTQNVVRSNREARMILMKATDRGVLPTLQILQAFRSLSRAFDSALAAEKKKNEKPIEPVAVMNGVPIVARRREEETVLVDQEFVLSDAPQMIENLNGEWKLQLLADKKGDNVKFYNTTLSWQQVNTRAATDMTFESFGPAGFFTVSQKGGMEFKKDDRIIDWRGVSASGSGSVLSTIMSGGSSSGWQSTSQQVISVDSVMLITRMALKKPPKATDDKNAKDFFSVWRRVEPGTYSKQ